MPSDRESKMNLSALKQVDPEINEIVDSATQVALYQYSTSTGQWAKTEVEGALFVYAHRNAHERGLIILNRHSPKNYKEPIRADIEFKIKAPFLIYKTSAGQIYGAWFYVEEECARIGELCCRLSSYLKKRAKQDSASNQQQSPQSHQNEQQQQGSPSKSITAAGTPSLPKMSLPNGLASKGDILNLLKKAQDEGESGGARVNGHRSPSGHNHKNGYRKKQPLTPNNSSNSSIINQNGSAPVNGACNGINDMNSSSKSENGHNRRAQGDNGKPGVPVVHKPVPAKRLPSSVEELFLSASSKQESLVVTPIAQKRSNPAELTSTPKTGHAPPALPGTPNLSENPLERLLDDLNRSSLGSPPAAALVETKVQALTPMNPCMASILNKLNESAQKVARGVEKQAVQNGTLAADDSLIKELFKAHAAVTDATAPTTLFPGQTTIIEKKVTLITPAMLEESLSQGPSSPVGVSRQELKSALVHLLETDDDFMTKIHNAYLQFATRGPPPQSN